MAKPPAETEKPIVLAMPAPGGALPPEPPIVYLFGLAGAGKNWVGELLQRHFGYFFYDADKEATPAMRQAIAGGAHFSETMRDEFMEVVAGRISELRELHPKLAVAQATYKERHRQRLRELFPKAMFLWVRATQTLLVERLQKRKDWLAPNYASQIAANFEKPDDSCLVLENDAGEEEAVERLRRIFNNDS